MADASPTGGRPPDTEGEGPLQGLRNWLRQLRWSRNGDTSLRESLEELIEEHDEEEPIDPHERTLLSNILKLHELSAADIMVPRIDIIAIEVETPFGEAVKHMVEHGHSRVPVYRETLDDVIGIVHIKDMLSYAVDAQPVPLAKIMRKVLFVAPSLPVLDLLLQMRLSRTHMALVVDEFGGIDGIVTIEDVIEEIVGDIEDEHDDADQPKLIERPDGTLIADARIKIEALQQRLSTPLLPAQHEEDIESLGGLVTALAGRVPGRG
jgi:magnesium and cobalt transporter